MFSKRYSTIEKKTANKSTMNESTENLPVLEIEYNAAEENMVKMSHTWDPIEKKVILEGKLSKKLSPFRHQMYA
jgi:hypothetical protein